MITYIPAREWHFPDQKPDDEEVIGYGMFPENLGEVEPSTEIVAYDKAQGIWLTRSDDEFNVLYWTELPTPPYKDTSRKP